MAKKKEYLVIVGSWSNFETIEVYSSKERAYTDAKDFAAPGEDVRVYEIKQIATAYVPEPEPLIEEED